ncbi:MAG: hypothetical protein VX642_09415, partial [Bdellovibrionota bacterium]|nr:hypothetical protein [Bdellovibrionota bacterium]
MRGDKDYRFRQFKNFLMEILFLVFSAVTAFAMDHQDCKSSPSFRYKSEQANLKLKILVDAYVKLSGMPKDASSEFMRSQFYKSLRKFYLEFDEHSFTALSNYLNSALNSPKLNQTKETTKRKKKSEFYDTLVTELSENDIYVMKVPNTNLVFRLLNETDSKSVLFDANHNTGIEIELTKMQYSSKAIKLGTAVFVYSEEANKAYLIYKNNGKYKKLERNLDRDFKLISQSESSLLIVTRDGSLLKFLRDKDSSWSIYKRDLDLSGTNYIGDQKAIEMGPGAGLLYYRESGEPTQLKTVVYNISADRFQLEKTFIDEVNEPLGKHLFMGKGKIQKLIHENE